MNATLPRIVVLISGQGRNLQALIDAERRGVLGARIVAVISNKPGVAGLARAQAAGIATQVIAHADYADRAAFDAALAQAIDTHDPQLVVLAGFMRVLTDGFVRHYLGRLINIHPSLLPKYPGLHTHQKALDAGDAQHGATVHFVTEQLDGGPAIIQGELSVGAQDDALILAERVMSEVEVRIYPQAVAWIARGWLRLRAGHVEWRGRALAAPLGLHDLEEEFRPCAA